MSFAPFDLPLGIRLWPSETSAARRPLREGYLFSQLENSSDSYRFSAVVGADRIAKILRSLPACLPEECFLILEYYQDEDRVSAQEGEENPIPTVYYSPYLPTREIIATLEPYLLRLIHDGFVGFGLANNREGVEFFYSEEKVLTCFTGNHIRAMNFLASHQIPYDPELSFPTDLGHDHLSLQCHPKDRLPAPFRSLDDAELDYLLFCGELTEQLDMYPVEETLSFFLSKREQDLIEAALGGHNDFSEFAEDDFGSLLLDWNDFVSECEAAFEGDLWEYRQGLYLRDMIQHVIDLSPPELARKLGDIVADADNRFQKSLVDRRKRLDPPSESGSGEDRFWYRGIVRNQGACLRRDLIRQGWFSPEGLLLRPSGPKASG